jgi:hypothetical protein
VFLRSHAKIKAFFAPYVVYPRNRLTSCKPDKSRTAPGVFVNFLTFSRVFVVSIILLLGDGVALSRAAFADEAQSLESIRQTVRNFVLNSFALRSHARGVRSGGGKTLRQHHRGRALYLLQTVDRVCPGARQTPRTGSSRRSPYHQRGGIAGGGHTSGNAGFNLATRYGSYGTQPSPGQIDPASPGIGRYYQRQWITGRTACPSWRKSHHSGRRRRSRSPRQRGSLDGWC